MSKEQRDVAMIIIMRKDLKNTKGEKIRTGKFITQAVHSAFGFIWNNLKGRKICFELTDVQMQWHKTGQTKITLAVNSEKELLERYQAAKDAGLEVELITDAGRTEFAEPTKTCFAIMPNYRDLISPVTENLSTF